MYQVFRIEDGHETLIGVTSTSGEASQAIEQDKEWLGREAGYRWQYTEEKRDTDC